MRDVWKQSLLHSLGAAIWIALVAAFMQNANDWFGKQDSIVSVTAILLLFSTSALVVGGLLVGKSIFLYIDGKKKQAVQMLVLNGGWLLIFFAVAIIILANK